MHNLQSRFPAAMISVIGILSSFFLISCSDNVPGTSPSFPVDDAPVTSNIWNPDQPVWTPSYDLPANWQIHLDNTENARSVEEQGLPAELKVFYLGFADQYLQPSALRDQLYQQVYCQQEDAQNAINCLKGFTKISQFIGEFQVEILHYYGTWQDDDREVNEIFVNHHGQILHLTAEGDFDRILPALESLLQTIQWKLEKPSIGSAQEPEETGL